MKFSGNFVMTKNNEVEKGKEYQYYESMPLCICNVIVEDLYNNEDEYGFTLKITDSITEGMKVGDVFKISAAQGNFAYGGMWRLYDKGTYRSK